MPIAKTVREQLRDCLCDCGSKSIFVDAHAGSCPFMRMSAILNRCCDNSVMVLASLPKTDAEVAAIEWYLSLSANDVLADITEVHSFQD